MHVFYLGRAPRTKETLPDFMKWRRVTRYPLVFRGLTGSQRTPGFGASQASTNKAGRKRGTPRETPTVSNLIAAMFVEGLRSFRQVPVAIILETLDDTTTSTIGATDNAI